MLVAGNIGGTKTDLAIFKSEVGPLSPLVQARVHSADFHRVHGPHPDPRCCQSSRTNGAAACGLGLVLSARHAARQKGPPSAGQG